MKGSHVERVLQNHRRGGFPLTDIRLPGHLGGRIMRLKKRVTVVGKIGHTKFYTGGPACVDYIDRWVGHYLAIPGTSQDNSMAVRTDDSNFDLGCRVMWEDK